MLKSVYKLMQMWIGLNLELGLMLDLELGRVLGLELDLLGCRVWDLALDLTLIKA